MSRHLMVFLAVCAVAALLPALPGGGGPAATATPAVPTSAGSWPGSFEGRTLERLELGPREAAFARDFPGGIARFHDGRREVVIKRVTRATRKLHPAATCFRAQGYEVSPLPLHRDRAGRLWSAFTAARGGSRFSVREQIRTLQPGAGTTDSWADVSAWFWAALLGRAEGPWECVVVAAPAGAVPSIPPAHPDLDPEVVTDQP